MKRESKEFYVIRGNALHEEKLYLMSGHVFMFFAREWAVHKEINTFSKGKHSCVCYEVSDVLTGCKLPILNTYKNALKNREEMVWLAKRTMESMGAKKLIEWLENAKKTREALDAALYNERALA